MTGGRARGGRAGLEGGGAAHWAGARILLIGPKGVGKTLVGYLLSEILRLRWVDSDVYLYRELGFPSKERYSPQEFKRKQELEFRALLSTRTLPGFVFSSGEGLILNQSPHLLKRLSRALETMTHVILLLPRGAVDEETLYLFRPFATMEIETEARSVEEVLHAILQRIGQPAGSDLRA